MNVPLQLFIEVVVLLASLVSIYVALTNRITKIEARQEHSEKQHDKIERKLDHMAETLSDIQRVLENKQNRN